MNSVALSFSDFGFNGPVNPLTFSAMVIEHGDAFLNRLAQHVAMAGYDGEGSPELVKFANPAMEGTVETGGIWMSPPVKEPVVEEPVILPPPILPVYDPAQDTAMQQGSVSVLQFEQPAPMSAMDIANGQVAAPSYQAPAVPASQAVAPGAKFAPAYEEKRENWLKKHQDKIIIAVIIVILLMLMMRRQTPVIIK